MYICIIYVKLTDNHCQDDQDDDDENDPQFHILPPQLALQTSRPGLEHVCSLLHQLCVCYSSDTVIGIIIVCV